ncbi:virion structural protein [Salmonella phage SPAsTU]|nr:virion structural protein [Salmonella phage SPAsTU]
MDIKKVVGESDQWFEVTLADLSKPNAFGVVYDQNTSLKKLVRGMVRQPRVFCEFGQPDLSYLNVNNPADSDRFICRQSAVNYSNVCGALSNIRVRGQQAVAELRPWGPHASVLRDLLNEEKSGPTFAIRGLANEKGHVDKIITIDLVG